MFGDYLTLKINVCCIKQKKSIYFLGPRGTLKKIMKNYEILQEAMEQGLRITAEERLIQRLR